MVDLLSKLWLVWIGVAVLATLGEVLLPHFGLIFAAMAALVAAVVSTRPIPWEYQLMAFAVALMAGLLLLRPQLVRKIQSSQEVPSRTQALVGKRGKVSEAIDPLTGKGRVDVEGQDWAARSKTALPVGATVTVEGADGIVLNVKKG